MQTAYDTDEFAEFMCSIRGNDINSYTYADVIQVSGGLFFQVMTKISLCPFLARIRFHPIARIALKAWIASKH